MKRSNLVLWSLLTLGLGSRALADAPTLGAALQDPRTFALEDARGQRVRPLASTNKVLRVLLFLSVDCPICNRYAPEIRRLVETYEPKRVQFLLVHPVADETGDRIRKHAEEYRLPGIGLRDDHRLLTRYTGATVTPEAVVLGKDLRIVYRGRIDDWFPRLGQQRARPTRHDLREAIEAALAGRPIVPERTRAIGCSIPDAGP